MIKPFIMQQNRIKSFHGFHRNGNPMQQKQRSSNIPVVSTNSLSNYLSKKKNNIPNN